MRSIILAAGKGKRLGQNIPKCLQVVGGKTILQRQLDAIAAMGVKDLVCVVGYQKEVVAEVVRKIWPHEVVFIENPKFNETNTSYSLYLAREYMNEDFFYMNADVVFRPDLLDRLVRTQGDAVLGIQHKQCNNEEVKVVVDTKRIIDIGKKLDPSKCLGEFVGIALFRKSMSNLFIKALSAMIDEGHHQDYFEGALIRITQSTTMKAVDITDIPCIEIDFPEDLKSASDNAGSFDMTNSKKSFKDKIRQARQTAQAPRIAMGEDWYSEHFTRYFTIYFSYFFSKWGISPNSITIWSGIFGLLGSICIVFGNIWLVILGGLLWQLWYALDCIDGEVARLSKKASKLGVYIDALVHIFVNPLVPFAFGLHIFLKEQSIANAVCAFLLYAANIWNSSIRKATKYLLGPKNYKRIEYNKKTIAGSLRLFLPIALANTGQMLIIPVVLVIGFLIGNSFLNYFLYVYTLLSISYILLLTYREVNQVRKIDLEKSK